MAYSVVFGEKKLIFSAPVNEATKKWGVYCIPRLWREPDGKLIIRFNGEMDCSDPDVREVAPNLYFVSSDSGETWILDPNGADTYKIKVIQGITPPYLNLSDGRWIAIGNQDDCKEVSGVAPVKEFLFPNGGSFLGAYPASSIPDECMGMVLVEYDSDNSIAKESPLKLDFSQREILAETKARDEVSNEYKRIPVYIKPVQWTNPYISALTQLPDGTVCGIVGGQHPEVSERFCGALYLVVSKDGGRCWKKRSTIAMDKAGVPYGYGGDAFETSLALTGDGTLVCAMRMDVSAMPKEYSEDCEAYIAISEDMGYTWSKPFPVAEASVTPQLVSFDDNLLMLIYGRPGVHFKISEDGGRSWSEDFRIIGRNYTEARALGISDADSKYCDMESYSNVFAEKINDNTVLVCFNDMKYDEGDGIYHRAGFVQKITVKKEKN